MNGTVSFQNNTHLAQGDGNDFESTYLYFFIIFTQN